MHRYFFSWFRVEIIIQLAQIHFTGWISIYSDDLVASLDASQIACRILPHVCNFKIAKSQTVSFYNKAAHVIERFFAIARFCLQVNFFPREIKYHLKSAKYFTPYRSISINSAEAQSIFYTKGVRKIRDHVSNFKFADAQTINTSSFSGNQSA